MKPIAAALILFAARVFAAASCESLAKLVVPHVEIASAVLVAAGPTPGPQPVQAPERCVVKAVSRPTQDSEIKIEIWLPQAASWNGKYQQVGNGGWAGSIPMGSINAAVRRGFAAAGTDDGHAGGGAAWSIGHPEKLIDFGHRSLHETAQLAKAVMRAYYETAPARNYFFGCSDGGREALMEAQRYPEDFDGIIAGAPANQWSYHLAGFVWNEQALNESPESFIPQTKLPAIQKAVVAKCDSLDGVKDGLIEDPRKCNFDPAVLLCKEGDSADCLTAAQIVTLKKIYAGPTNPRTGKQIYPGYPPGHEAIPGAWAPWIIASPPDRALQFMFGNTFFGQAVFEETDWNFRKLNFDSDVAFGFEKAGIHINSSNPDLRSFRAHGGKLIQYHGWADGAISPLGSIAYYESVVDFFARYPDARMQGHPPVQDFYRLFMVPGMGHCGGGIGPNSFGNGAIGADPEHDVVLALDRWVEKGIAPEKLIGAGKSISDPGKPLTRPLCPYPQTVRYDGSGDPNDAASFSCVKP